MYRPSYNPLFLLYFRVPVLVFLYQYSLQGICTNLPLFIMVVPFMEAFLTLTAG